MTDRPIIFSAIMIRTLLAGTKTQTRRVLKPLRNQQGADFSRCPAARIEGDWIAFEHPQGGPYTCIPLPFAPGDRLWVREAHALLPRTAYRGGVGTGTIQQVEHPTDGYSAAVFRECFDRSQGGIRWRPSIHMPRWASRITLHVEDVRVQRVQEISAGDCYAEGCFRPDMTRALGSVATARSNARNEFAKIWNSIHGPDAWRRNPWVCAITFRVIRANIDAPEAGAGNEARRE